MMKIKLRQMRKEKGWSQQEMAEKAGLSIDCIKSLEIGRSHPSLKTAVQLRDAFQCGCIDELIESVV